MSKAISYTSEVRLASSSCGGWKSSTGIWQQDRHTCDFIPHRQLTSQCSVYSSHLSYFHTFTFHTFNTLILAHCHTTSQGDVFHIIRSFYTFHTFTNSPPFTLFMFFSSHRHQTSSRTSIQYLLWPEVRLLSWNGIVSLVYQEHCPEIEIFSK